ncbi:hypothetical protein N9T15_00615 [Pelagibacteraceae bacterium]|nr:hypothetical protein [Pelagibacteraceae bacterium]
MRFLVFISLLFFNSLAHSRLEDKGLLCEIIGSKPIKEEVKRNNFLFHHIMLFQEDIAIRYFLNLNNDKFNIIKLKTNYKYSLTSDYILLEDTWKINRKSLIMYSQFYEEPHSKCEVYSKEETMKEFHIIKKKYQKEYNKKLEGNKI